MNKTLMTAVALAVATVSAVAWLHAAISTIGPSTASPAYIVVNTITAVTFTTVISDSSLRKHDPRKVLLIRTDSAGTPIDIVGRMNDRGKRADLNKNDRAYTIEATLNEPQIGTQTFRIAARFKDTSLEGREPADDDNWDGELALLVSAKSQKERQDRLSKLLRKLDRFTLSDPFVVIVDPFELPPDPGEGGRQTLEGIDSDHDGVRDDVQRYIALTYRGDDRLDKAFYQLASGVQQGLAASSTGSATAIHSADQAQRRSNDCLEYVSGAIAGRKAAADVTAEVLNTSARSQAYARYRRAVGAQVYMLTPEADLRAGCTFDPGSQAR